MIEVEIKLPINDKEKLCEKLLLRDFCKGKTYKETDVYFNRNDCDLRKSDEALRVRETIDSDTGETKSVLTYKGPKLDSISMSRKEVEVSIDNPEGIKDILVSLGFFPVIPVVKSRVYFKRYNMTAAVDEVQELGTFLELEILVDDESRHEDALSIIREELSNLGYSFERTITTSYLSMLEGSTKD